MNAPFSPWMSTPACILEQEVVAHLEYGDPNIRIAVPCDTGAAHPGTAALPLIWALVARMAQDNNMRPFDAKPGQYISKQRAQELIALVRQHNGVWLDDDTQSKLLTAAARSDLPSWWTKPREDTFSDLQKLLDEADKDTPYGSPNLTNVAGWMEYIAGKCKVSLGVAMFTDESLVRDYMHSTENTAQRMHPLLPLMQGREVLRGHIRLSRTDVWRVAFDYLHQRIGDNIQHLRLGAGVDSVVFTELRDHPTGVEKANALGWVYNRNDVWHCWNGVKVHFNQLQYGGAQLGWPPLDCRAAVMVLRNFVQHATAQDINDMVHFILPDVIKVADAAAAVEVVDLLDARGVLDTQVVDCEGDTIECITTLRHIIETAPLPNLLARLQHNTLSNMFDCGGQRQHQRKL